MEVTGDDKMPAAGRIAYARRHMPVLVEAIDEFKVTKPFEGMTIGFRLHIETKTTVLIEALMAGGARVVALGNVGTTQSDAADYLRGRGCVVLDEPGDDAVAVADKIRRIAAEEPDLVLDNGAELIVACLAGDKQPLGATEETTSGATLLREGHPGEVGFPVIVINDSPLKSIVENKHGVGESVVDAVQRVTNITFHKRRVVVFGYGWCGRGIALYAGRKGADVIVVEPDPIKLLEAAMDGYDTATADEAVTRGEVFIAATGRDGVVPVDMIRKMIDGALLANAGHVDREIDVAGLRSAANATEIAPTLTQFRFDNGKEVFVVADGHIVNLAADGGKGNPIEAMDLGFTLQVRSLELLA